MDQAPQRRLVAIGVESPDIPKVPDSIQRVVQTLGRLGYRQELGELSNLKTGTKVPDKVSAWGTSVDPADLVVLYWAGHGRSQADGMGPRTHYLGLPDTDWDRADVTALPTVRLLKALTQGTSIANLLVILDVCYSGQGVLDAGSLAASLYDAKRDVFVMAASLPKGGAGDDTFAAAFEAVLESMGSAVQSCDLVTLIEDVNHKLGPEQKAALGKPGFITKRFPEFFPNPDYCGDSVLVEDRLFHRQDLEQHWKPRAMGAEAIFQSGRWYFTGRTAALRKITTWLNSSDLARAMAVTGDPGSGKSAVLGLLAIASDPEAQRKDPQLSDFLKAMPQGTVPGVGRVQFALSLRGKTVRDVKTALGTRFGATPESAMEKLTAANEPTVLIFDALDESAEPATVAEQILRALTGYAHLMILVGTRREYVQHLGPRFTALDLDAAEFRNDKDVALYVERLLLAQGETRATPYRGNAEAAGKAAKAVAEKAQGNFLVARTLARMLLERNVPFDPAKEELPTNLGEAFDGYLKLLAERAGLAVGDVRAQLEPLAYAKGNGLPSDVWEMLLGKSPQRILEVAAAFVSEYAESNRTVYRLYHQALADALHDPKRDREREERIAQALYDARPSGDWLRAHWYTRKYFAAFAAAGDEDLLASVVKDVNYLAVCDVPQLLAASRDLRDSEATRRVNWVRLTADRLQDAAFADNLSYLQLVAGQINAQDLVAACQKVEIARRWRPRWVRWRAQPTPHRVVGRHDGEVKAVAIDGNVVVSGGEDHTVRFWELSTGRLIGSGAHDNIVTCVSARHGIAASGGWDEAVRLWHMDAGTLIGEPLRGHKNNVLAVAVGDGFVASTGDDCAVILWDLKQRIMIGEPLNGHTRPVSCLAIEGNIIVSGGEDGTVRRWDAEGKTKFLPLKGSGRNVTALAVSGGTIWAVYDRGLLQMWSLMGGEVLGQGVRMEDIVNAIAVDGADLICGGGSPGFLVRLHDAHTGEPRAPGWTGHQLFLRAVAIQRDKVISGAADGTIRVWDRSGAERLGVPDKEADSSSGLTLTGAGLASVTPHGQVSIWETRSGRCKDPSVLFGGAIVGPRVPISGNGVVIAIPYVDPGEIPNIAVYVSTYSTATAERKVLARNRRLDSFAVTAKALVTLSSDGEHLIRRWDLESGSELEQAITLSTPAYGLWSKHDVAWICGRTVSRRKIDSGDLLSEQKDGFPAISSLAFGESVALAGYYSGDIRLWDVKTGVPLTGRLRSPQSRIESVAIHRMLGLTSSEEAIWVWNLASLSPLFRVQFGSHVNAVVADDEAIYVGCADGIVCLEMNS